MGRRKFRRILFCCAMSSSSGREELAGIRRFGDLHRWDILTTRPADLPRWVEHANQSDIDGCIGAPSSWLLSLAEKIQFPIVLNYGGSEDFGLPNIGVDDFAIGRLAAQHLYTPLVREYVFVQLEAMTKSAPGRLAGFREELAQRGVMDVRTVAAGGDPVSTDRNHPLHVFLRNISPPVAVFCEHDIMAVSLLHACLHMGVVVPEQITIIGAGYDGLLCDSSRPTLSSIEMPNQMVGYRAAELLDRVMHHRQAGKPLRLPPTRVVQQASSQKARTCDALTARALVFIREHVSEPLTVDDLLVELQVSRTKLVTHFRKELASSPGKEILQARMKFVAKLLLETDMTLVAIAQTLGYPDPFTLSHAFKRIMGKAPITYRNQFRIQ